MRRGIKTQKKWKEMKQILDLNVTMGIEKFERGESKRWVNQNEWYTKKKKKTYVNSVVCIVFLTFIFIIILFFLSSGIYSFDKTTSFLIILHIEYGHTKKERGGINVLVIGMLSHNLILRVGRNEYLRPWAIIKLVYVLRYNDFVEGNSSE